MNKWRKNKLRMLAADMTGMKAAVEGVIAEETATAEKMPPRLRRGERGQRADAAIGHMEAAADLLARARDEIETITEIQDEEGTNA